MKLNLGCGNKKFDGYLNVDIREEVHPDLVCDVSRMGGIKDNSVDEILADDVLEHFAVKEVSNVLKEWHRVLKPNGQLYFKTPDLERYSKAVLEGNIPVKDIITFLFGGQDYPENFHKCIFTKETIKEILNSCGFVVDQIQDAKQYALNMEVWARKEIG